jgi:hypothetical protein
MYRIGVLILAVTIAMFIVTIAQVYCLTYLETSDMVVIEKNILEDNTIWK